MRPNNFDLIRLLAALQVVYCHTCFHLDVTTGLGNPAISYFINWFPGVPVFFTLSGFLISRSWERCSSWRDYAKNRALRIYPALWAQLALGIVLLISFGAITPAVMASASFYVWLIAQSTFAQFYSAPFLRDFGLRALNGSLWTIPVELGFYVLLPALYWGWVNRVNPRRADIGLCIMTVLSFVYWFHLSHHAESDDLRIKLQMASPFPHLHMFLVGVLLQRHFERVLPLLENRAPIWLAAFSGFMLAFNPWGMAALSDSLILVLLGRLLLAATVLSVGFSWRPLSGHLLRGNDLSYGVYLYHAFGIHVLSRAGWTGTSWDLVIVTSASVVLAGLSWRLVEKPAISLKWHKPLSDPASEMMLVTDVLPLSRKVA